MSSRLHNKYHRHNHHTEGINDPRYPDASHDPIASHDSPFLGDFVLNGTLSAYPLNTDLAIAAEGNAIINGTLFVESSADITGSLTVSENVETGGSIEAQGDLTSGGSIEAEGDLTLGGSIDAQQGNLTLGGSIDAQGDLTLGGSITATSIDLIDSGDLLLTGALTATNITLTNANIDTYYTPLTAAGEFLVLNINGMKRAIRLWKEI